MIQALGFLLSFVVLGTYFFSQRVQNMRAFNWANFLCGMVLIPINLHFGAYFGAFMTGSFALIGLAGILTQEY